jgi:hypothetical protein
MEYDLKINMGLLASSNKLKVQLLNYIDDVEVVFSIAKTMLDNSDLTPYEENLISEVLINFSKKEKSGYQSYNENEIIMAVRNRELHKLLSSNPFLTRVNQIEVSRAKISYAPIKIIS